MAEDEKEQPVMKWNSQKICYGTTKHYTEWNEMRSCYVCGSWITSDVGQPMPVALLTTLISISRLFWHVTASFDHLNILRTRSHALALFSVANFLNASLFPVCRKYLILTVYLCFSPLLNSTYRVVKITREEKNCGLKCTLYNVFFSRTFKDQWQYL